MKKNIMIFSLFIVWLSSISFLTYNNFNSSEIINVKAKHIADFTDKKKVSWFAENIFVWKILKNNSTNKIWKEKFYRTEFEVEVLYNIKWKLDWNIIASQSVWYDKKWKMIVIKWNKLMKKWEIYILATKWNLPYKIMSHPNWTNLLTWNVNLDKFTIQGLIKENQKIKDWRKAYKNEIFYEDNYKISTEKNSYKKLSKENKEKFENIENGFLY